MNLLDKATKKALNAGEVAMIDGKYIVITPETLYLIVKDATMEAVSNITMEQATKKEPNRSSIVGNTVCQCHFCGKRNRWGTEYTLTIAGGYGSDHDMESKTVEVCAGCLEKMLAAVN